MAEATHIFFYLPDYYIFMGGICLVVLSSLLSIVAPVIRNRLHINWLIPSVFTSGLNLILIAFAAVESIQYFYLIEALLKIITMLFLAEFTRRNWPTEEELKPTVLLHIPLAFFAVVIYAISRCEPSPAFEITFTIIKLLACFTALKSAQSLTQEIRIRAKATICLATIAVLLQTAIGLAMSFKLIALPPGAGVKSMLLMIVYIELILILIICIELLVGRFFYERSQKFQSQSAFNLLFPVVIFMTTIFLSITVIRLGHHFAKQQQIHTATVLDKSIFSLTQLINQRILFASTSSDIMATSPIMAQYLENPDEQQADFLNKFLKSFTASNPGTVCFVMNTTGLVLAASDFENLMVGQNLWNRSYFQLALSGKEGNLIDYGVLTGALGYYSSHPIRKASDNSIIGVCVVKKSLDDLENILKRYHPTMLLNCSGNVFLASEKRLAGIKLQIPHVQSRAPQKLNMLENHRLLDFPENRYFFSTMTLENQDWQLLMLMPYDISFSQKWAFIFILLVVFVFVAILSGIIQNAESLKSFEIARNQFKIVYDNAPESIFVVSLKSLKILEANQSTLRQFALSYAIGLNYFDLMPSRKSSISNAWHNVSDKIFKHERDFKKQNGDIFTAEVTGSIIEFNKEKALLLILHDISLHKAIEDKLREAKNAAEEANALKARFFANASHEIRTPMTAIIGLTELAVSLCSSNEQKHILELVRTAGKSMLNLLNDFLDLAQIETGRLKISLVQFNLHSMLRDLFNIVSLQTDSTSIKTSLSISNSLPEMIISDPDRIRQVLLNLLTNALKMTRKGEIKLSASFSQSAPGNLMVDFTVFDTRPGISAENQQNLFGAFIYTDPYIMDETKSSDLGLSISKQIIDLMGGKISAETKPGDGVTFKVSIPVLISKALLATENRNDIFRTRLKTAGRPLNFLVADDNEINLFLASSIIEKFKGTSQCVRDGIEVLNCLQNNTFDAVLLDIQMPRLDGIATIKAIRQLAEPIASIPVIAISAFASDREKLMAKEAGAQYYLAKPYFPEDFLNALKEVLTLDQAGIANANSELDQAITNEKIDHNFACLLQIDRHELELRILKKPENILQISEIFTRRSEALEEELNACINEKSADRLREVAHSIKGLTGMLAANAVFELARNIEHLSRDGEFAKAVELVPSLKVKLLEIAKDLAVLKAETEIRKT